MERLKARLYYRRNKSKIKLQRKRYLRTHKSILKRRKLFQRYKPSWMQHKKPKAPKVRKFRVVVPKKHHS